MYKKDSEYIINKDWVCNNPTEYELRFNDESDVISSDSSDIEENNSIKAKKYNQLLPRGKIVNKLLHSARHEFNKSWFTFEEKLNLLKKYDENDTRLTDLSDIVSSDSSETEESNTYKAKDINDLQSRFKTADEFMDSTISKVNQISKKVKSKVDLPENLKESEFESVSYRNMSKNHKRKRDSSTTEEEEAYSSKKIKIIPNESKGKKVKHKEIDHNISCSEDEGSDTSSARTKSKGRGNVNESNKNTHLLSSESDNGADSSYDLSSKKIIPEKAGSKNTEINDSEHESINDSEEETNHVQRNVTATSTTTESSVEIHRIPEVTHELNEEISKFSLLLDKNLVEKNDIWILQCPQNMDCSALVNQRLSMGGSCQLEAGGRTYEAYSYRNTSTRSATLAVPSERNRLNLCRIPITGNIIVEESVKSDRTTKPNEIIPEPSSRVEFPENLRTRHPLLGLDFSKQPRTAERVAERLSKKKKHLKKYGESRNGVTLSDLDSTSINTSLKKEKKKKDRINGDVTLSDSAELPKQETSAKKKKKKHKDNDSFD